MSIDRPRKPFYLGLGDSMSDDTFPGPDQGTISLLHKNHPDFPEFKGRDLETYFPNIEVLNLAKDGLTSAGVIDVIQKVLKPTFDGALVTLTTGGNDILQYIQKGAGDKSTQIDQTVDDNIDRILRILQKKYKGDLSIILGTIYDPLLNIDLKNAGPAAATIDKSRELMRRINERMRKFEDTTTVSIADIHGHFAKNATTDWYIFPYEPSKIGASEIRRVFWNKIEKALDLGAPPEAQAAGAETTSAQEAIPIEVSTQAITPDTAVHPEPTVADPAVPFGADPSNYIKKEENF